jgi:Cys-tRNA(Pro)/Cys-tRNA(Cys) deacylase
MAATRALQALERAKVPHRVHEYEMPGDEEGTSYGEAVARAIGADPSRVYKTLVAVVDGDPVVAVVPVGGSLSMKALARARRGKRADLADPEAAERLTGYVVGGISPFGQRRRLPMVVDDSLAEHATVFVSAGRRGIQVEIAPEDLIRLTGAARAAIAG